MSITIPPAPSDQSKRLIDTYTAGETLSALKLVVDNGGKTAFLGEKNSTYEEATVIGVTLTAATLGNQVEVLLFGLLEDASFTFPNNVPLFLTAGGTITDSAPVAGEFFVRIGRSQGTGAIFVDIEEPTELLL